jgi:hypothetical protein
MVYFFLIDKCFSYRYVVSLPISRFPTDFWFCEILKKYSINQYKDIYVSMIVE